MFRSRFRDFDWTLLGFVLVLCVLSVVEIRSATAMTKFHGFQQKQMVFLAVGLVLMFAISLVDYHRLLDMANWAYALSLIALVAVLVPHIGQKVLGARRWINFGGG
ncbi:MAG: FtsW/RodA/SpoVE family cell cycle protein, partial [Bryocella sp.]